MDYRKFVNGIYRAAEAFHTCEKKKRGQENICSIEHAENGD